MNPPASRYTCLDCAHYDQVGRSLTGYCRAMSPLPSPCRECFHVTTRHNGEVYTCGRCGAINRCDPCGRRGAQSPICDYFEQRAVDRDLFKSGPNRSTSHNATPPRPSTSPASSRGGVAPSGGGR